jgi:hypothetical protein
VGELASARTVLALIVDSVPKRKRRLQRRKIVKYRGEPRMGDEVSGNGKVDESVLQVGFRSLEMISDASRRQVGSVVEGMPIDVSHSLRLADG